MTLFNGTEEATWGSALQGRDTVTTLDIVVGLSMFMLSATGVVIEILNIYVINKLDIFHNAFGALWVSRTLGEMGYNFGHILYSAPVTILQPKGIHPTFGFVAFIVGYLFLTESCAMNQLLSLNRLLSAYSPFRYHCIFNRSNTRRVIISAWFCSALLMSLYYIVPCSLLGYSPQFYEYVYVQEPQCTLQYSLLFFILTKACTAICFVTLAVDCLTAYKIIKIKRTDKKKAREEGFRRNVRFFAQAATQNIGMMIALVALTISDSEKGKSKNVGLFIAAFDTRAFVSIVNSLALILFNPEVRNFLGLRFCRKATYMSRVVSITDAVNNVATSSL